MKLHPPPSDFGATRASNIHPPSCGFGAKISPCALRLPALSSFGEEREDAGAAFTVQDSMHESERFFAPRGIFFAEQLQFCALEIFGSSAEFVAPHQGLL